MMKIINAKFLIQSCFFPLLILFCSCGNSNSQNKIQSFEIYGRHNSTLKDSSRIMLSYTTDEETFMYLGTLKGTKPKMQRIHSDIHCLKSPEIFSTMNKIDTLSFTSLPYFNSTDKNYNHKIYTYYNKENYNDIIVYLHPQNNIDELERVYDTNSSPDFVLYTIKYNDNHEEIESDAFKRLYILDKKRDVYFDKLNYINGEENAKDYDYNNQHLLFIYRKMNDFKVSKSEISIDNNSIFKNNCQK